jgi:hypothetical protein
MANRALPLLGLLLVPPVEALAQGVQIDHKAVGCIVAGKFPKMNACFNPASNVGRARVYFRPEGAPSWYYVEMKSDAPCHAGVLPKPSKKLIDKKIEYYVEVADRSFNAGRTSEYGPVVVGSESECRKDLPIAPISAAGPAAVFPAVPVGFVSTGAIGATTAVIGVAAAGAATAGVVVATQSDDDTTTTTIATGGGGGTTTLATVTTTSTTTTTTLVANRPPFAVLRTIPDPPRGPSPLTIAFDACASSDPDGDPLSFFWDFGDGVSGPGGCSLSHTYVAASPLRGPAKAMSDTNFNMLVSVQAGGQSAQRSRTIEVLDSTPPTVCPAPSVTITAPTGNCTTAPFGNFTMTANATQTGGPTIADVTFAAFHSTEPPFFGPPPPPACDGVGGTVAGTPDSSATDTTAPYSGSLSVSSPGSCYELKARATNSCGATASDARFILINAYGCAYPLRLNQGAQLRWSSQLDAEGTRLQVVMNGADLYYPGAGRAFVQSTIRSGQNRLEATVVESGRRAGTWRLEFFDDNVVPGSVRVLGGDVVSMTERVLTFRLKGAQGERVVVTFETY